MQTLNPFIKDLSLMLGIASVSLLIFQKLKQPIVLAYLIAGIILGPSTFKLISDIPTVNTLSGLGVIFLMFSIGLDFSFQELKHVGLPAGVTGFFEILCMLFLGFFVGRCLGWDFNNSLFLGAALCISSTTIISKVFDELKLKLKDFAKLSLGVLIIEDLLAVLLLAFLSIITSKQSLFSTTLANTAIQLFIVVLGWFLIGYFLIPSLLRLLANFITEEILTVLSVAFCLMLVCLAAYFHYSTALGAFIMGSILAETEAKELIKKLMQPLRDIFAAVFFLSVGMLVNPHIIIANLPLVFLITFMTIFGKIFFTCFGALITGKTIQTSIRAGFSLAQIGEFSFIIAGLGLGLGVVTNQFYDLIVGVSVLSTFTTPYLIRLSAPLSQYVDANLPCSLRRLLTNYANFIYRYRIFQRNKTIYVRYLSRLLLNAILITLIFGLSEKFIFSLLSHNYFNAPLANTVSWLIALLLASPFIWGMLFSFKVENETKKNLLPILILGWIFTATIITTASITFFYSWPIILLLILIMCLFFFALFKQLGKSYHWLEGKLVENIYKNEIEESPNNDEILWDAHLSSVNVAGNYQFINKTLAELCLNKIYGIYIIAIYRGETLILSPSSQETIKLYDQLVIFGNDNETDSFLEIIEKKNYVEEKKMLIDLMLQSLLLKKNHPFIGRKIQDILASGEIQGLVIGLERAGIRFLNPDPLLVLEMHDLLLLVLKMH